MHAPTISCGDAFVASAWNGGLHISSRWCWSACVAHGARLAHLPDQDMIRGVRALGARKPSPGLGQCQPAGRAAGSRPNAAGVAAAAQSTRR